MVVENAVLAVGPRFGRVLGGRAGVGRRRPGVPHLVIAARVPVRPVRPNLLLVAEDVAEHGLVADRPVLLPDEREGDALERVKPPEGARADGLGGVADGE